MLIALEPVTSMMPPTAPLKSLMVPPLMVVPDSVNVLPSSTWSVAPLLLRMSLASVLEPVISIVPALLILVLVPPAKPLTVVLFSISLLPLSTWSVAPLLLSSVSLLSVVVPAISIRPAFVIAPLASLVRMVGDAPVVMLNVLNSVCPCPSSMLNVTEFAPAPGI